MRDLTKLCKVVIRSGEDLVYTGNTEGFAPDIRDALEIYVDESGSKVVVVTLLHKPEEEEEPDQKVGNKEKVPYRLPGGRADRRRGCTDRYARADRGRLPARLDGSLERPGTPQDLPASRVLKFMGSPWRVLRGRTLAKIGAVAGLLLLLIAAMYFVPCDSDH